MSLNFPAVTGMKVPGIKSNETHVAETSEGLVRSVDVTAGPFDLHRKYRSMEGPYVNETFRVSDMLATKEISVGEAAVKFVENGNQPSMMAASGAVNKGTANGAEKQGSTKQGTAESSISKIVRSSEPKQLVWAKGVKLIVLDENNKPMPTGEFICHFNIDVDPRSTVFPEVHAGSARLFTLTQGEIDFRFPEGYGVPLSSNEFLHIAFQAANRTTNAHRRIKHVCTVDFIKDSELKKPLKPLSWYTPYVAVQINKNTKLDTPELHGPACMVTSAGENAPNATASSVVTDSKDNKMTGHWRVPPGVHPYTCPISEERDWGFTSEDRMVRAVWTHVHPLCKNVTLMVCDGNKKTPLWSTNIETKNEHGLEIKKIGDLYFKDGVLLQKGKHFEIDSVYDNNTGVMQDSMVSQGIFFDDTKFVKPNWSAEPQLADSTGSTSEDYNGSDRYSPFDPQGDGPLLTESRTMEVTTSAGKLHVVFDPSAAPQTATQLYKLFKAGAFDDTKVIVYQPNYIFQMGSIDIKHNPRKPVTDAQSALLRRLPLEVEAHNKGYGLNKKWALSMARSHAEDSAVSSFSILLNDAPHLDHHYTVFGHLIPDAVTVATMKKMMATFYNEHPHVISAKDSNVSQPADILALAGSQLVSLAAGTKSSADMTGKQACDDRYCGIKPTTALKAEKAKVEDEYPIFNPKTDGPLLKEIKVVEMKTSAGVIRLVIDPSFAPANATQMYKLFKAGAFDGTSIVRYEPNFVLQTALAETKEDPSAGLRPEVTSMLRRLPLEIFAQQTNKVRHTKYALSMAHGDDPNSAVTSFSIVLKTSPHLDLEYSIFGRVANDPESLQTIKRIESEWESKKPHIITVTTDKPKIASSH